MNFTRFLGSSTNVFPIANSKTGGQLLTEYNLRSRESVTTNPNVKYEIGPSCTHSQDDFKVRLLEDELGTTISTTILEITSGRALVNGHFLESLSNVTIDLAEANNYLNNEGLTPLKGKLAIGLRAMYSTEQTLSATLLVENNQNFIEGMQIVILPIGKIEDGYFVLPEDSPDNDNLVTAHLKLAEFNFVNGNVKTITQNEDKVKYLDASRIGDFGSLLSGTYVTRNGLNPKKLYTFAGKAPDPDSGHDTWCDSTDSLFIWQKASDLKITKETQLKQAEFGTDIDEYVNLTLPHKEVDGGMYNLEGQEVFYTPRIMRLPKANWSSNTPGTIDGSYTRSIKSIKESVNNIYKLPNGKQRGYVEEITDETRSELPTLNPVWEIGDYILVCTDNSVAASSDMVKAPSTFYTVTAPVVQEVEYIETRSDSIIPEGLTGVEIHKEITEVGMDDDYDIHRVISMLSTLVPDSGEDIDEAKSKKMYNERLGVFSSGYRGQRDIDYICVRCTNVPTPRIFADKVNAIEAMEELASTIDNKQVEVLEAKSNVESKELEVNGLSEDVETATQNLNSAKTYLEMLDDNVTDKQKQEYKDNVTDKQKELDRAVEKLSEGQKELKALQATYNTANKALNKELAKISPANIVMRDWNAYYKVSETDNKKVYSNPNILTGPIPFATEERIGGFLNATDTDIDNGYVIRDDDGHLRLLDYSLLRSGVLAYQLGEDWESGSGLSTEELQIELDEYVNERVAFPTVAQQVKSGTNGINLNLELPNETIYSTLNIQNIDSRWGTFVWLHITGDANDYTTINIVNCEKIIVTVESGNPSINIINSNVYYNPDLLERVLSTYRVTQTMASMPNFDVTYTGPIYEDTFTGIENISFWYQKLREDDANLIVDGMTITETDTPIIPEDVDFWSETVVNDNHYFFGLQSLTFAPNGTLAGCGLYMRNDMSANVELTKTITAAPFELPQGSNFSYPKSALKSQIKITGSFVTAYPSNNPDGYITMDTQFTALTQQYNDYDATGKEDINGTISFLSNAELIENFIGIDSGTPIDGWESNSYHVFKGWTIG